MSALLRSPARRWSCFTASVLGGAAVVWARSVPAHFVGDDAEEVLRAAHPARYPAHLSHPDGNLRPLAAATYRLNERVFGLRPWSFHAVNVGIHAANAVLVAVLAATLLRRWGARRAEVTGMLAGLVFLVLPTHTEAVSYISARADLLATGGCLVAAICWIRSMPASGRRDPRWVVASVAAFAVALASKESAVTFPAVLVLLELVDRLRSPDAAVRRAVFGAVAGPWPTYLLFLAYLGWRRSRLGTFVGSYDSSGSFDWNPVRLPARAVVLAVRTVLPGLPPAGWVAVGLLGLAALAAAVARIRAAGRPAVGGVAGAMGAVLVLAVPGAGLGVSARHTEGERLAYLPSTVSAVLVGLALMWIVTHRGTAGRVMVAMILVASTVSLVFVQGRWARAGDLAERVLERSTAWRDERPVTVLNPPDTIDGVYVARNALGASPILLHGWSGSTHVGELTKVRFAGVRDPVSAVFQGPGILRLRLEAAGARFEPVAPGSYGYDEPGFTVRLVDPRQVEISISPDIRSGTVWYVTEGRLVPLHWTR